MTEPHAFSAPNAPAGAPRIAVVGSLNMDIVLRVARAPGAGETVMAESLAHIPGGKGGNQAVACARQGARVQLLGRVGNDAHGQALRAALEADGIGHAGVQTDPAAPTGVAAITVDATAQNRIVVVAGANGRFQLDTAALGQVLQGASNLLLQFEVPLAQVVAAAGLAQRLACPVVLNPSPMQPMPDALWPLVDTLVANEVEAALFAGCDVETPDDAAHAARLLRARGPRRVVVTLGAAGAVASDGDGCRHHPGLRVEAVDTTAAGDTFLGALTVALARGESLDLAVQTGIRAAALCVTRPGAQPSIPTLAETLASPLPPDWSRTA
ncbi:ribokinase [Acidovorax sp. GBBC 3334]|uniref:ribokinase n=1 Tax=Acidovorax sp. GBBC 3334 TaxID=2940496 RepID=UPI0023047CBB|nr:ribokinase [Acidovorax sp. GBBC 3334]MDA8455441.1 ribokinase [Acidovorax sp. GBBC 3334]